MLDDRNPPRRTLLCISQSFPPDTTPTAIRAGKLLERLNDRWDVEVLTESAGPSVRCRVRVHTVAGWRPRKLLSALRRARLDKLLELLVWPDDSIFWVLPAILAARRLSWERAPAAIVVFMMPYSAGLAGVALGRLMKLPLVLNLDDSPTCTDMHPSFPTHLHYRLAKWLEDMYARRADAVVYVSETNLEAVGSRMPAQTRAKFHLVRYGGEPPVPPRRAQASENFEIAYVGAMSGWWALIEQHESANLLRRAYRSWIRLGRYERTRLDVRSSSPAYIGQAILDAISEHPAWKGRIRLSVLGDPNTSGVVDRALRSAGVENVVTVLGPVPHDEVAPTLTGADLLFLSLPARPDGSRGGRISAKTYEYLTTNRPILAAVPPGENWDYLTDMPGVWLVEPDDRSRMREVIIELAGAKFSGSEPVFDRAQIQTQLSYDTRAAEFAEVIAAGISRRGNPSSKA